MESVGRHLKAQAVTITDGVQRDMFGRSAFNRYYYAIYFEVKSILGEINSEWYGSAHGSFPGILRGSLCKKIKGHQAKAQKMSDLELNQQCERALSAARTLANIMEDGYAVRVTADYHSHNIPVEFDKKTFQLNETSIDDIESWLYRTKGLLTTLRMFFKAYG